MWFILLMGIACVFVQIRNHAVYKRRNKIIDAIYREQADFINKAYDSGLPYEDIRKSIEQNREKCDRFYNRWTYSQMLWMFWIPVKEFYEKTYTVKELEEMESLSDWEKAANVPDEK